MALSKINLGRIADDSSIKTANIVDGTITNADVNASAAIVSSKTNTMTETQKNNAQMNVALLGFKMAVTESLTVFNLVDGVVDEFHDESGTDEGEGSNDNYCGTSDFYDNIGSTPYSAGFSISAITEPDTSTTVTNPAQKNTTLGSFTVPTGMTSLNMQAWGGAGGTSGYDYTSDGGGGGYAEGTVAVTASQVIRVAVGEGGAPVNIGQTSNGGMGIQNGGGNAGGPEVPISGCGARATGGGGASGVLTACASRPMGGVLQPEIYIAAGGGGGSGYVNPAVGEGSDGPGGTGYPDLAAGGGGGLVGGTSIGYTTSNYGQARGGGGDQEQGGDGGTSVNPPPDGAAGSALAGGRGATSDPNSGGGGDGYYGGGGGGSRNPTGPSDVRTGGGGSSYYGHPQVTSGSTEAGGPDYTGGGTTQPGYVAGTNEGVRMAVTSGYAFGEDGYVLLTGSAPLTQSSTIVSNAFTASSEPSTSRIVVFQEDVSSTTLNTDIVASVSRDGGSNFTNVTLADEGYVTGSSGQRILSGVATISGQPSGTSMRWKLALANNQSKIHGVSLSWG